MKRKFEINCEIVEIINKPGKFAVLTQWVDGGPITHDHNDGPGYTRDEAEAVVMKVLTK